ncbi:mitochondrial ribosomal protein L37-domain-containing protein [Exophiala viscosa]|uniref:mitochondrial ribosomal protein L37-domain-containing protein n=1 Tax=Exophiala viscosa TaxID=2486360 RepID=UPI0021954932|nr:mitochondrial ribosomal protein L37-domain-containing protein [Exophiala viscosa]
MLCSSCRRTFLTRFRSLQIHASPSSVRSVATVPSTPNAAPIQAPPSISIEGAQTTTSSKTPGKSQPLSEPHTPSTSTATSIPHPSKKPASKPKSSVPGGVELKGLAYTKALPRITAMEDDEYPSWLWTLLDDKNAATGELKVDLASMTKKQRARYDKKQERLLANIPKTVPLHEQSRDLTGPGDDAVTSLQRRQEITKSARAARRRDIREGNFLKSM